MALARIKTWIAGEILKAADQNGEFNNILNNPITLLSPTTGAINFNLQAHTNLIAQTLAVNPVSTAAGRIMFNTALNQFQVDDGTLIRAVPTLSATALTVGKMPLGSTANGFVLANQGGSRVLGLIGTISSQVGSFQADQYTMRTSDATGSWTVSATSSYSANIGTAGPIAGGRDVAAAFASTEVHWYTISTGPLSTAPACIVSSKAPPTGPVMPSSAGYVGWTYLGGSIYSSASTTVPTPMHAVGNRFYYDVNITALNAGASTAETTVVLTSVLPSNAAAWGGRVTAQVTASTAASLLATLLLKTVTGNTFFSLQPLTQVAGNSVSIDSYVEAPNIGQAILYNFATTLAGQGAFIFPMMFTVPNGG
jgi:hypothetical protein